MITDLPILPAGHRLQAEAILAAVISKTGIGRETLLSRSGTYHQVIWPRHELTWLLHEYAGLSRNAIGRLMDGRDPTTIRNSLRKVTQRASECPDYRAHLVELAQAAISGPASSAGAGGEDLPITLIRGVLASPTLSDADARAAATAIMERFYG
ncbi:helix-turn-helix domain-containing protein [Cereibacter azotoformans]|uniref:DnaA-like protein n=1 Tax=Cereibacter azotoformans TaxID=43057 RepID=A0A2T5JSL1_9RHOB|nr:helix-turn-helix domain-containing protein [Cereibacter azotoformans]MBO4168900.1 chromosomal replication initiator DnaA [Cereibacter azotoformans]PTR11176.1 DnaA-like protein [Cereibacter azotoformans]